MDLVLTFALTALLALSSLVSPPSATSGDISVNDGPGQSNKSPCLPEEVNECQASGGIFDWRTCMCRYM